MDYYVYISQFISPLTIVGTYVVFVLIDKYLKVDQKYQLLISVSVGILFSLLEHVFVNTEILNAVVTGALSGLISVFGNKTISKLLKK